MSKVLIKIKNNLKYTFVTFFILSFFFWWISFARTDDILWQIMLWVENRDISVDMWDTPNEVWKHVFEEWTEVNLGDGVRDATSVIVKFTRLLLSLVVVIAVTMILYNWMSYIIQTW